MEQPTPTTTDATTLSVTVPLVSGELETEALGGEIRYCTSDPYAVTLHVTTSAGPVTWTFSRDLLAEGLYDPAGDGDVQVWPCLSTDATAVVIIELHAPRGDALLQTPSRAVAEFVADMYRVVPAGTESAHLDLDTLVGQLLAD
jgi:hypothetical protein